MSGRPVAIDLYCGLGGWTRPLLDEGWQVFGFDIERHEYGGERYPGILAIQDVRTLHGAQFRDVSLIVASPPCTEYSWMAMPWSRAKQVARALRGEGDFPENYKGSRTIADLNALFDACFRIQREACEAAGRHIPLIVENVRGAQPWVGRARWNYGSYYLWGDVPALMPKPPARAVLKPQPYQRRHGTGSWFAIDMKSARAGITDPKEVTKSDAYKSTGLNWSDPSKRGQDFTRIAGAQAVARHYVGDARPPARMSDRLPDEGRKSVGSGPEWWRQNMGSLPSSSPRRKAASAIIAKIPYDLARHIAVTLRPT